MAASKNLLGRNGEAFLIPQFLSKEESGSVFATLRNEIPWRMEPIKLFGKLIMQPRLTFWCGESAKSYAYSGIVMQPQPWPQCLIGIKNRLESLAGAKFSNALLNLYRNERDSMGWHRDNEKELGPRPTIASLSLGEERVFELRLYREKNTKISFPLPNGSVLIMGGDTQVFWEHRVPKAREFRGERINITFRNVN